MGLALQLARRSLVTRPGRTLFSILGVAVGIATVVAVFTVDHVSVLARTIGLDDESGADWEVRPAGELADPRRALLALEGVAGVAAFFQNDVAFRPLRAQGEDDAPQAVKLVALESAMAPSLGVYRVDRGSDLDPARKDRVLVGRALAEACGLAPGDRVLLAPPRRAARKRCVDGVLQEAPPAAGAAPAPEPFEVAGVLAAEGVGRRSGGRVVVMDYDAGRSLFRDVFIEAQYWVRRSEDVDPETLEGRLGERFSFERNARAAIGQMADERAFRNGVRLAGLFALLLGLYVIFHTLSMSLLERVREVAALVALGTTRAQVARVFFAEALVIALAAGVLGVAGGILLAALLLSRGISTLGVADHPVGPFEVPWGTVLPLALSGVGIALVGSVHPLLRTRGADVLAALRGEDAGVARRTTRGVQLSSLVLLVLVLPACFLVVAPLVGAAGAPLVRALALALGVLALVVGVPLLRPTLASAAASRLARPLRRPFPLAGMLAARSLGESPSRVSASVTALALVVAAFVALRSITASLAGEVERWGERALTDRVFVEGLRDVRSDELRAALHELEEVVAVEPGDARVNASFLLIGLPPDELARYGPLARDPELARAFADEQVVLVSERLAAQRALSVGDVLSVGTSGHGVQPFRVAAISDEPGYFIHPDERAYAVVADERVHRYFCLDLETTSTASVRLAPGADPAGVEAVLRARFGGGFRTTTGARVLREHLADIRRDFVLFDVILLLTAALAGLGVLNGQLLAALERQKELGVLVALGMTKAQLALSVVIESLVLGAAGGAAGALVGSALAPLLVTSLRALSGLDLPRVVPLASVAASMGAALVLALAAGGYPLWRMNRTDVVRAVRTG